MKIKPKITALVGLAIASALMLTGCEGGVRTVYELAHYNGTEFEELTGKPVYNQELWNLNTGEIGLPDPFVLDNTQRDGYYYVYGTGGLFGCYRSQDLSVWESMGEVLNLPASLIGARDLWAPEVVFDAGDTQTTDDDCYYMFFSATPVSDGLTGKYEGAAQYMMMAARAKDPFGPFTLIDFTDENSCGKGNVHTYQTSDFPHYYAKYAYFDPQIHYDKIQEIDPLLYEENGLKGGYLDNIDPHPYVTPDGQKYLYFIRNNPYGSIIGVKMKDNNWMTPDYDTYTILTRSLYYTTEEYEKAKSGETVEKVSYEMWGSGPVNEGPQMYYHSGKYYLAFSANGYGDAGYCVAQAVGDTPLGPFRKLREEEGGVVISGDLGMNPNVSGSGHNSFFNVGDKLYIAYHKHNDVSTVEAGRHFCIDEVKWVKIEGINGEEFEVMYSTPTTTVQPKIVSDYKNIAAEAQVSLKSGSLENGSSLGCLTDGLLSFYKYVNTDFIERYVNETKITKKSTFSLTFNTPRQVRAVMLYNSKNETDIFTEIDEIRLYCEENGKEKIYVIRDVPFLVERFADVTQMEEEIGIDMLVPGATAYAEFKEVRVRSMDITVSVPDSNKCVGISEIAVLGK